MSFIRPLSLVIVLAACSSKTQQPSPSSGSATQAPTSLAMLVPDDATAISVWRATDFPFLALLDAQPEMYRCWRELEQKIELAYQVFTADRSSLVILVGDLPRAEVRSCAQQALGASHLLSEDLRDVGGQLVAVTRFGRVHAGWRGGFAVFGKPADVTRALASVTPSKTWAAALDTLPGKDALGTTAFAAISHDATFAGIVGVPTTSWKLVLDAPSRPWPAKVFLDKGAPSPEPTAAAPEPRTPTFKGRVELRYGSAADAKRAAEVFTTRAFPFELEENLALALSKLPQTVADTTLTIEFTQDSFPGVSLEKLQAWIARAQAAATARPTK